MCVQNVCTKRPLVRYIIRFVILFRLSLFVVVFRCSALAPRFFFSCYFATIFIRRNKAECMNLKTQSAASIARYLVHFQSVLFSVSWRAYTTFPSETGYILLLCKKKHKHTHTRARILSNKASIHGAYDDSYLSHAM